jgi:hypothetical protein
MNNPPLYRYYPSEISDEVYIEIQECPYEDYDIHRLVEMPKEEYELSWEGMFFGDKRKTGQIFFEKKVPLEEIHSSISYDDFF